MVNTEPRVITRGNMLYYNILNIVVNTEPLRIIALIAVDYNILNIVVNTEPNFSNIGKK